MIWNKDESQLKGWLLLFLCGWDLVIWWICTIFALRRVRSLAAPQQLKYISLRSACTDFVGKN
jgi:hypothetical protein